MEFFDGFEQFRTGDQIATNTYLNRAGYVAVGTIGSGIGRLPGSTGLYTLNSRIDRQIVWATDTLSIGFACQQSDRGALIAIKLSNDAMPADPHTIVYTDPESSLVTIRNTDQSTNVGYITPLKKRWYYYELTLTKSTGKISVSVNGKPDVDFDLDPAIAAAASPIISLNPYNLMPAFPPEAEYKEDGKIFDDMYIRDGAKLGPVQITGRLPTSDVKTEWQVSTETGSGPHFLQVGQLPPDMNNRFIFTAENGKTDSFKSLALLPENGTLISQGVIALVRKATADPVSIVANIDNNTVNISNVGRNWEYRYTLMPVTGYDIAAVQAAEFGVRSDL